MEASKIFNKLRGDIQNISISFICSAGAFYTSFEIIHQLAMNQFKDQVWSVLMGSFVAASYIGVATILYMSISHLIKTIMRIYDEHMEEKKQGFFTRNFNFIAKKIGL